MRFFVLLVLIPFAMGALTAEAGLHFFDPLALAIYIPVCALSATVWAFTEWGDD